MYYIPIYVDKNFWFKKCSTILEEKSLTFVIYFTVIIVFNFYLSKHV